MSDILQELPNPNTRKYQICVNFLNNYPLNQEQFSENYGMMGFQYPANMRCEFDDMVKEGLLREYKGSYSPTAMLKSGIKIDGVDYVKPREPKPFEPMKAKHYLPRVSPRGQPLRDFCHIGLSNGAKEEGTDSVSVLNEVMSSLQAN